MKKSAFIGALAALCLGQAAMAADMTPADFVAKASESGMAEVQLGQLAVSKAASSEVRTYGERMVADHTKNNAELEALAGRKNLKVTKALNAKHQQALKDLGAKSGAEFDRAFAQQMVADHAEAVALFTSASRLQDKELAAFASKSLPVLQEHHRQAQHLGSH